MGRRKTDYERSLEMITEKEVDIGDVIETMNGNRYVVLPSRHLAYIGNEDMSRADETEFVRYNPHARCKIVGRLEMKNEENIEKGAE